MPDLDLALAEESLSGRLLGTVFALLVIWGARTALLALVMPRVEEARSRYWWRKGSQYTGIVLAVLAVGQVWWSGFGGLATFLGLLSAGIAVALRDWIANIFGWLYIVTWRPFAVGDRIELDDAAGDVIDIGLFATTMLEIGNWVRADQSTGRVVHVPNGVVMTKEVFNYSVGLHYIWNELRVVITFESDWKKAKGLLQAIADENCQATVEKAEQDLQKVSERWLITYQVLTPIVYLDVEESGVALTLRYLCEPRRRRGTEQQLWEAILECFAEHADVALAYPTWRVVSGQAETRSRP